MKQTIVQHSAFEVAYDSAINRLYLALKGFWQEAEVDAYLAAQQDFMKVLRPNFTLLADMRQYKTLPQHLIPKQSQSMEVFFIGGMFRAANIDPESIIAFLQMKKVVNEIGQPVWMFKSIEEGEAWLDAEVKKGLK